MSCLERTETIEWLGAGSMMMCVVLLGLSYFQWRKEHVNIKVVLGLFVLLCAHPYFWLNIQSDCGEKLKTSAGLFTGLALVCYLWGQYRTQLTEKKTQHP
jgi:hypothetical protein